MCTDPNILIPIGRTSSGKIKYRVLKSARNYQSHFKVMEEDAAFFAASYSEFSENGDMLFAPCGQCLECRLRNANLKAIQASHESMLYDRSLFLTLTYNDDHLRFLKGSVNPTLCKEDVQGFLRRLRRHLDYHYQTKIRVLYAGEYGDQTYRPHYHLLIYNFFPDDVRRLHSFDSYSTFHSPLIEKLWPFGYNVCGAVNFHSARYVAQYNLKKQTGYNSSFYDFAGIAPEFNHMSNKPGLGHDFFLKHAEYFLTQGYTVIDEVKFPLPRYYSTLGERYFPALFKYYYSRKRENALAIKQDFYSNSARSVKLNHYTKNFTKSYESLISQLS